MFSYLIDDDAIELINQKNIEFPNKKHRLSLRTMEVWFLSTSNVYKRVFFHIVSEGQDTPISIIVEKKYL